MAHFASIICLGDLSEPGHYCTTDAFGKKKLERVFPDHHSFPGLEISCETRLQLTAYLDIPFM